jgi:hypothetical protein
MDNYEGRGNTSPHFIQKKADPKLKWISFFLDEMAIIFNLSS